MTKHYFRDLVGQRFGRLIAIQMAGKSNSNQTRTIEDVLGDE